MAVLTLVNLTPEHFIKQFKSRKKKEQLNSYQTKTLVTLSNNVKIKMQEIDYVKARMENKPHKQI